MKLIIGLGNPGDKYKNNRHNVGQMVADKLKDKISNEFRVFKSPNFMNNSGEFVEKLVEQYGVNPAELWVIHDDLDIPLGSYKIQKGKGPREHHGLESIDIALGVNDYWHIRVGVDNRDPENRVPGEQYVLQDFDPEERKIIEKVEEEICKKLATS